MTSLYILFSGYWMILNISKLDKKARHRHRDFYTDSHLLDFVFFNKPML